MRLSLIATVAAAALFVSGAALAGPPGGNNGNGNGNKSFDSWGEGSVMSGSANSFGFSADFKDAGAALGGIAASGFNKGHASVVGGFNGANFDARVTSENFGNIATIGGVIGGGANKFNGAINAESFGQSLGEMKWGFTDW